MDKEQDVAGDKPAMELITTGEAYSGILGWDAVPALEFHHRTNLSYASLDMDRPMASVRLFFHHLQPAIQIGHASLSKIKNQFAVSRPSCLARLLGLPIQLYSHDLIPFRFSQSPRSTLGLPHTLLPLRQVRRLLPRRLPLGPLPSKRFSLRHPPDRHPSYRLGEAH